MYDDQFQKQIGGEQSQTRKALQGAIELAQLLCQFRAHLILGGFPPDDATEMAREHYEHLLGLRDALPDDFEEDDE